MSTLEDAELCASCGKYSRSKDLFGMLSGPYQGYRICGVCSKKLIIKMAPTSTSTAVVKGTYEERWGDFWKGAVKDKFVDEDDDDQ